MNSLKIFSVTLFTAFIIVSCSYKEGSRTVTAKGDFTLEIPFYMDEYTELLPGADIQYANRFRNLYLIGNRVNPDTLEGGFNDFVNDQINRLTEILDKPAVYDSIPVSFENTTGSKMEIFGRMNNETIYYHLQTIKGDEYYYYVTIWTRGESRWKTYKNDMNHILSTFGGI